MPSRARASEVQDGDVTVVEEHPAGVWPLDAGQTVEQRRLAGAVRADERGDRARRGLDRDVVDGGQAAEPLDDAEAGQLRLPAPVMCIALMVVPPAPTGSGRGRNRAVGEHGPGRGGGVAAS